MIVQTLLERMLPLMDEDEVSLPEPRVGMTCHALGMAPRYTIFTTKSIAWDFFFSAPGAFSDALLFYRPTPMLPVYSGMIASELQRLGACIYFVGDLDPEDLCVFFGLREQLLVLGVANAAIHYLGISDDWLALCSRFARTAIPTIASSGSERRLLDMLSASVSDVRNVIGVDCMQLLKKEIKLELEGALGPSFYGDGFVAELAQLLHSKMDHHERARGDQTADRNACTLQVIR
jgi:hypothetical protein